MKKICILSHNQFGYHIDSFNYCKYLRKNYEVHYISFDLKSKKIYLDGIKTEYINLEKNEFISRIKYIIQSINYIKKNNIEVVIDIQIPFSIFYKLILHNIKFIYDVRSLSVSRSFIRKKFVDSIIKFDSKFFKNRTIINNEIAIELGWKKNYSILPLGADKKICKLKNIDKIHFLYVGTLCNRNIEVTIEAFNKIIIEHDYKSKEIEYTIIGNGDFETERKLKIFIEKSNGKVNFKGYVENEKLGEYFEQSNIGISYIPILDCYDNQTPTKTYEYLVNGLVCLATSTKANEKIINDDCGYLIKDNVESVYNGMKYLIDNIGLYNREMIMNKYNNHDWENIIKNYLIDKL